METRLAVLADAPGLAVLHTQSFPGRAWNVAQIAGSLNLVTCEGWIVVDDLAAVGLIIYQCVGDEAEILTLCVRPDRWRQGIAEGLLTQALDRVTSKRVKRIFLEVDADNHNAIHLYTKVRFHPVHRRTGYYGCPKGAKDALVLERILNNDVI